MSLVTTKYSYPTSELLTRGDIIKRYLRETGFGLVSTVETGSSSTQIISGRIKSGQYRAEDYEGGFVRIGTTTDGNAPQGEIRPIDQFIPEQGKLIVEPPFSATLDVGDIFQVFRIVYPQDVLDHIDDIVRTLYLPHYAFLTEVPDGDMEQPTYTGDWQATNATITKATAEPAMNGKRYLTVAATSPNGYASLINPIGIEPLNTQFHVSAMVRCNDANTTARFSIYDATNSVLLQSKDVTRMQNVRLFLDYITIPSDCYQINLRLETVESGKTTNWDDIIFFAIGTKRIPLPWWVQEQSQVKAVFRYRPAGLTTNVYTSDYEGTQTKAFNYQDNAFGRGQPGLASNVEALADPLFIFATRHEETFSTDIETRHFNIDHLHSALMNRVFASLSGYAASGSLDTRWITDRSKYWAAEAQKEAYKQAKRTESALQAESYDVMMR